MNINIKGVEAIAWDLDGTLIDSFHITEQIVVEIAKEQGYKIPTRPEMLRNYHGSLEDSLTAMLGLKTAQQHEAVMGSFLEKQAILYGGDLDPLLFEDATQLAKQASEKGILQLLITNRAHAERGRASPKVIVAETILAGYIHEVRAADEVEYRKPDKRSVADWLDTHDIDPDNLLVIGDQFIDAQLAINLGSRALLVERNAEAIPHLDQLDIDKDQVVVTDNLASVTIN